MQICWYDLQIFGLSISPGLTGNTGKCYLHLLQKGRWQKKFGQIANIKECHGHTFVQNSWDIYLGSKSLSFTTHSFFSGTLFQVLGSAKSTRALAFSSPNPNRLFTIKPAPFFFHPGLLASGSYSEVQTTKCCISRQVRFGLHGKWPKISFRNKMKFLAKASAKSKHLYSNIMKYLLPLYLCNSSLHYYSYVFSFRIQNTVWKTSPCAM